MKKLSDLFEKLVAENDEVHTVAAYAFFVDNELVETGMACGLSAFDNAILNAIAEDDHNESRACYAAEVSKIPSHRDYAAACRAMSFDKVMFHPYNARKAALYTLYTERMEVLQGNAPLGSLYALARRFDNATASLHATATAARGDCERMRLVEAAIQASAVANDF